MNNVFEDYMLLMKVSLLTVVDWFSKREGLLKRWSVTVFPEGRNIFTLLQRRWWSLFSNSCHFVMFGSPSGHQPDHKEGAADHGPRHRRWTAGLWDHRRAEARLPGEQAEAWQPHHHLHTRYRESIFVFLPVWQELRPVLLFHPVHTYIGYF